MSSFLFFLYHYPPLEGSANSRNRRMAEGIARKANKSFVLTASPVTKDETKPQRIHIPSHDYRWLLGQRKSGRPPSEKAKSSFLAQWIIKAINTYPLSLIIGEGGWSYMKNLIRQGQHLIDKENITHLYSSYRPFADHYAAFVLKQKNPKLVWIADFRDLIIDPHYDQIWWKRYQQHVYKNLFSHADVLTTVSAGLADHLKLYNDHVYVLRNGISNTALPPVPVTQSHFTIVYTGSMFLDKRNPRPLFKALRQLLDDGDMSVDDVRIIYAGKDGAMWTKMMREYKLDSLLDNKGLVTQEEANQLQQQACINLLLSIASNELQGVLTGKLIELIESGSPVLAISVGKRDEELGQILSSLEIGHAFDDSENDHSGITAFIHGSFSDWKHTRMNAKPVNWTMVKQQWQMDDIIDQFLAKVDKPQAENMATTTTSK